MFPNIDPRKLKSMMDQMGIKTTDIEATKVVIYAQDKEIVITDPQVVRTEMQGQIQFQVSGSIEEKDAEKVPGVSHEDATIEITGDDIDLVKEKTGKSEEEVRAALEKSNGDIARAILDLGDKE